MTTSASTSVSSARITNTLALGDHVAIGDDETVLVDDDAGADHVLGAVGPGHANRDDGVLGFLDGLDHRIAAGEHDVIGEVGRAHWNVWEPKQPAASPESGLAVVGLPLGGGGFDRSFGREFERRSGQEPKWAWGGRARLRPRLNLGWATWFCCWVGLDTGGFVPEPARIRVVPMAAAPRRKPRQGT